MLNINRIKFPSQKKYSQKTSSTSTSKTKTNFLDALESNYKKKKEDIHGELNQMIDEMSYYGDLLNKDPNLEDFYTYRNHVKKVFDFLLPRISDLSKYQKRSFTESKEKYYEIVYKVDQELEDIFQNIQKEQNKNIQITDKIYEIKGLLVNFIVDN